MNSYSKSRARRVLTGALLGTALLAGTSSPAFAAAPNNVGYSLNAFAAPTPTGQQASTALTTAAAPPPHVVDVIYVEKPGTPFPDRSVVTKLVDDASFYWKRESQGKLSGIKTRNLKFVRLPKGAEGQRLCKGGAKAFRDWGAAKFNKVRSDYVQSRGQHLMIIESTNACGNPVQGSAILGKNLQSGGAIWLVLDPDKRQEWNHPVFHEFGHSFGLRHSDELTCKNGVLDSPFVSLNKIPSNPNCSVTEYGDAIDVMGKRFDYAGYSKSQFPAALNVNHRLRLGILSRADVPRYEAGKPIARNLKLPPSTNRQGVRGFELIEPVTKERYFIEYRAGLGADANSYYSKWPAKYNNIRELKPGVRILRNNNGGRGSMVLNRPGQSDEAAARPGGNAYVAGDEFKSASGKLRVRVNSLSNTAADLCVTFTDGDPYSANRVRPKISGTPAVGKTLKTSSGTWGHSDVKMSYKWYRNGKIIPGATGNTYLVKPEDRGATIYARALASKKCFKTNGASSNSVVVR